MKVTELADIWQVYDALEQIEEWLRYDGDDFSEEDLTQLYDLVKGRNGGIRSRIEGLIEREIDKRSEANRCSLCDKDSRYGQHGYQIDVDRWTCCQPEPDYDRYDDIRRFFPGGNHEAN